MLRLNTIKAQPGSVKKRKRLGRGQGSGHGATAGKGDKGQLARTGGRVRPGFEGGQMPLYRRIPKRGFKNPGARAEHLVNLKDLSAWSPSEFAQGCLTLDELKGKGIAKRDADRLVVLADGELAVKWDVKAHRVSAKAREALEKLGGRVELLPKPGKRQPKQVSEKVATKP